jgi:DNA invertase Pin-like site-specific DNA recombinase
MPRQRAIAYVRTSTDEQRNGADAQRARLTAEAGRRGWALDVAEEHASGKTLARRPVLRAVLDWLDAGDADLLAVTRLDRLVRSTADFAAILDRAARRRWSIAVLDMGGGDALDTSSATGRAMARMVVVMAELERELIGERTREGLAVVRARGVQLGKPSTVPREVRERIAAMRSEGLGTRSVAARLNAEGVPAPSGRPRARWHSTSVARHSP